MPFPRAVAFSIMSLLAGCGARIVGGPAENAVMIGGTAQGELTLADPMIALPGRGNTLYATDTWSVDLTMGETVTIALCENAGVNIDPYLVVAMNGMDVQTNDDGAGGYNGRGSIVSFTPMFTGTYDLFASTFRSNLTTHGTYTIHVFAGAMTGFRCPQ